MIIITGAAGFIGSCLVGFLNRSGNKDLILVDEFKTAEKYPNFSHHDYDRTIERDTFLPWFSQNSHKIDAVYHIGARTDTSEMDWGIFEQLNVNYSKYIWKVCTEQEIPLIYASSAATYGGGEHGYTDNHDIVEKLQPLNPYGDSKQQFDLWALEQENSPPFWAGLKFFNVYGPNEYHKGRMASVIMHGYNQISDHGSMKLFRSHNPAFADGEQKRDFIYIKDVVRVITHLMNEKPESGLYNVGTGKARTFLDLAKATFNALETPVDIEFIDTPKDIRDKYQYFTEADMNKLRKVGNYSKQFTPLEVGIRDYVRNYLVEHEYY